MDYVDIVNDLIAIMEKPEHQMTELEGDIALLNVFEIETLMGGGTSYFDSSSGDNLEKLSEAAIRHVFPELTLWFKRVSKVNPDLMSLDRDTRCIALSELSADLHETLDEEGSLLAEKAHTLWVDLIENNMPTLEAAYQERHQ